METDTRKQITSKYPTPENFTNLSAPELNGEIQSVLNDGALKQDKFLAKLQGQISSGLVALATSFDSIIEVNLERGGGNEILPKLADTGHLFADLHHAISAHRRYLINPYLNAECKKAVEDIPVDTYLFGAQLQEKIKATQAMKRAGDELKVVPTKRKLQVSKTVRKPQNIRQLQPSSSLNYRRPYYKARFKPTSKDQFKERRAHHRRHQ